MTNTNATTGNPAPMTSIKLQWEALPPVSRTTRSNATTSSSPSTSTTTHRAENPLIQKLQKELQLLSLLKHPSSHSPPSETLPVLLLPEVFIPDPLSPPQPPSNTSNAASSISDPDIDVVVADQKINWDDRLHKLPKVLDACIRAGMTACEIGQYLHRIVYGCDPALNGLVTRMVNEGRQYHEIGRYALRSLDLRDETGVPVYEGVRTGDARLRAEPGASWREVGEAVVQEEQEEEEDRDEAEYEIVGVPVHGCASGNGEGDEDGEGEDEGGEDKDEDEEWDTNVALLLTCSIHKARPIVIGEATGSRDGGESK